MVGDEASRKDTNMGRPDQGRSHSAGARGAKSADSAGKSRDRLLPTLERLLSIDGTNVKSTLDQTSDLIAAAISADKSDTFLYEPSTETLVAVGTSHTPMGERQRQIGLDRLPIANGGPEVAVFHSGECYLTGHADEDPTIPLGLTRTLGIRSTMIVPVYVGGERRGVIQACSAQPDAFTEDDLTFLDAVAHWVGALTHRAELVERIAQDATAQARQVVAEELVTVLAHDLGNYITPLKGRLDLVSRRARREGRVRDIEDLDAASRALNRLQSLIGDLLDIGRLDQGLFSISPQPTDLAALIQETLGVMRTGRLDIVLRAPEELVVEVDPLRVRQVLENLLSNARKHSPRGMPVEVGLTTEKREDGEWAIISVHDQGPGIPEEFRPRLFTRFGAGPSSTGLGLGLYLARSIAEAHGGTLTVEAGRAQGTTFQLALPMALPKSCR